ncbi:hypothetical protein F0L68_05385 [Solihabitans fulvus]|uniref:Excreted virulence factor EspC, type VII ESX diderm n=1 Tax=Solihabitans fulvus TaxID=1892852 RepID=A0A5B2XQ92_9PSEU|nr:type VII secretion target [Solihabitans fulvus]KAA2265094.1 hypothetical protein F0L68_05385 [Solihabitans fulvus]
MTDGGYQVSTGQLQSHATSVQQVAATLGQALSAAQQVALSTQAYGMICGPLFVPIVMAVSAPGVAALQLAQQSINSVADEVKNTAAHYETVDQSNSASFTTIQGGLS